MRLRFLFTASALTLACATQAFAADIVEAPIIEAPVIINTPIYSPVYSFDGLYAGLQLGGRWFSQDSDMSGLDIPGKLSNANGFLGGLYLGYNWQFSNNVVAGIETDFAATTSDDAKILGTYSHKLKEKWNGATRLRLGYAYNRLLPYLSAGISYNQFENTFKNASTDEVLLKAKDSKTGYTVGAGLDYAISDQIMLRLEYRYSDYGSVSASDDSATINLKGDYSSNDVRVGIGYKF